jgi:NADH-quinone oxidoreductase subunit M
MLLGLLLIPLVGALLVSMLPARWAAHLALGTFLVNIFWGVVGFLQPLGVPLTSWSFPVIADFGIGFGLWADGVSWILMILTLLFFGVLTLWYTGQKPVPNAKFFWNCVLVLQTALLGLFSVNDMLLFYLFLELTLLPIVLLIGKWGNSASQSTIESALWFLMYTLAGSFLLFSRPARR